jgi:purine-binding chemotaxis protein CheW
VTGLRGQIVAVVELRKFFGIAPRDWTDLARLVILGGEQPEFGILADAVHEVATLRKKDLLEPAGAVSGVGREYLRGITAGALIVLDGAALLQDPRLFIDQAEDSSV